MQATDALLRAALRGEIPAWPDVIEGDFTDKFLERSAWHGVQPLLHGRLELEQAIARGWPREVLAECHRQAIGQAMWEMRPQALLIEVLEQLGIQPVLFKGTALAYGPYPSPMLRSRGDSDLLVPFPERGRVAEALERLGFRRAVGVSGHFINYQASFTQAVADGWSHTLDLHWRISNSQLLAGLFSYEELRARAQSLPELALQAFAACPVDALLLACMHRCGHKQAPYYVDGVAYYSGDRLIWLYDIHLLAVKLTSDDWHEFIDRASEKGLRAVCRQGLGLAQTCFDTPVGSEVIEALTPRGEPEPIAQYLEGSAARQLWLDFCAIDGWRDRLAFMNENLFPSASYMQQKYPEAGSGSLPWHYVRRATGGLVKRLKGRDG
jgi:hypothetical protein